METLNAKQEAIKKAYGEYWENVKNYVDENGYLDKQVFSNYKGITYEEISSILFLHNTLTTCIPLSLQGIENNNGWIRIESDNWLKKHKIDKSLTKYYINDINEDYLCIAVLVTKDNIEFEQLTLSDYLFVKEELIKEEIFATHYQPIEKPKPPIY